MASYNGVVKEYKSIEGDTERHLCICRECNKETLHYIIFSYNEIGTQECDRHNIYSWHEKNQIIQCLGCETVSFRTVLTDSESYENDYDENGEPVAYHYEKVKYYPAKILNAGSLNVYMLPDKIHDIYKETALSIEHEQYVLAGIGIRAIVETICKDLQADGKNLHDKINSLMKMSIVTTEGAATLHKLRVLGNEAAHEVKSHNSQQLRLAMEIIEHMLEGTYVLPKRVKEVFK